MDDTLIRFVEEARERGVDHATVRRMLLAKGWRDGDIAEAFSRQLELPIPAPARSPWPRRARDGFLHLLMFGSLYTWVTSLILLYFTYLDFALPDPAWRVGQAGVEAARSVIRGQVALLVVAFPAFMVLWHFLLGEVRRDPEKARGAVRRWMAYLAMFVGAITLAGDAITLIYYLLEGQLTLRLVLKAGVLFVIAGSLVVYLAMTLRGEAGAAT